VFATLIIATIETINAAGLTKVTKFITILCSTLPIIGKVFNGVALVAINTIDATKNNVMFLSSMLSKPTIIPKISNKNGTQFVASSPGIIPKIIEIRIPSRKAYAPIFCIDIFNITSIIISKKVFLNSCVYLRIVIY
jgi:hypothetical protein